MADKLNPDPFANGTSSPSFLGASRGSKAVGARTVTADTSGATRGKANASLVSNAAQLGLSLFDQTDKAIQREQKKEFQAEFDNINNEFGVGDATNLEVAAGAGTPRQITDSNRELKRLKAAQQAGKLGNTAYWGRVQSVVRQLRSKYPAYRDQIDGMVSGITGTVPANALRRSILADSARRGATGKDPGVQLQKLEKSLGAAGNLPMDWSTRKQTGQPYTFNELLDYGNKRVALKANLAVERAQAGLVKDRQSLESGSIALDKEKGKIVFSKEVSATINHRLTALTGTDSRFGRVLAEVNKRGDAGKALSQKDQNEIRQSYSKVQQEMETTINEVAARYAALGLPISDVSQAVSFMRGQVTRLGENLTNKHYGLLQHNMNVLKSQETGDAIALKENDKVRQLAAFRTVLGDSVANTLVVKDLDTLLSTATNIALDKSIGQGKAMRGVVTDLKSSNTDNPKVVSRLLDTSKKVLLDPKSRPEALANTVKSLFGEKNIGFLSEIRAKDREAVFNKLTTPDVAKRIFQLRDSDPSLWTQYRRWTLDSFGALMRSNINATQEVVVNRKFLDLEYNESAGQFEVTPKERATQLLSSGNPVRSLSDMVEAGWLNQQAITAVDKLNKGLLGLIPVFQQEGGDPIQHINGVVKGLGINLNAREQGPGIESLWKSVLDGLRSVTGQKPRIQEGLRGTTNLGLGDVRPTNLGTEPAEPNPLGSPITDFFNANPSTATQPNQLIARNLTFSQDKKSTDLFIKFLDGGKLSKKEAELVAKTTVEGQLSAQEGTNLEITELRELLVTARQSGDKELVSQLNDEIASLLLDDTEDSTKETERFRSIVGKNIALYLQK